jgi:hypothetical protein
MNEQQDGSRAEFMEWVKDRGCDTDGAWSAWQAASSGRSELLEALKECRNALLALGVGRHSPIARDAIDSATALIQKHTKEPGETGMDERKTDGMPGMDGGQSNVG